MKITFISDTHTDFNKLDNHPYLQDDCDILIHCGDLVEDFKKEGKDHNFLEFLTWFKALPAKNKVFIAGNHDFQLERNLTKYSKLLEELRNDHQVYYLQDSFVIINDLKIYGTPIQPDYHSYAFNVESEQERYRLYSKAPDDTNILVTHTPPFGILDLIDVVSYHPYTNEKKEETINAGCKPLMKLIEDKFIHKKDSNLLFNCFGHIHACGESVYIHPTNGTKFVNCALATERAPYRIIKNPIQLEI
jgi:Icc-related predicted phosphoesterase